MKCAFCDISNGLSKAEMVAEWPETFAIVPLNPVTDGHVLVIPRVHVGNALDIPFITGMVITRAAELATDPCNLITSVGKEATQTVKHLHVHIIPRVEGDGLCLPWSHSQNN